MRELISNASDALNKVRFMQLTNQNILEPERD
jgi:HSP90 family molecular chaperone